MKPKLLLVKPPEDRAAIVDEWARLGGSIPWESVRRHEALGKLIRKWYEGQDAQAGFTVMGNHFRIAVGPRTFERRVKSMAKLFGILGRKLFLEKCAFGLGVLEDLLPGSDVEALTVREQTGYRPLEAFPLADLSERAA